MPRSMIALFASVALLLLLGGPADATDYHVYYLGGQSNMDGFGKVAELPAELAKPVEGVPIFHGAIDSGDGKWTTLQPGHGRGFQFDGSEYQYGDRFGVEVTFARTLQEASPDRRIAIIKYSKGGTSIAADCGAAERFGCWEPDFDGDNQYDYFLATLRNATAVQDIDGDGQPDRLIPAGIVWMQGESDGVEQQTADRYEANLKRIIDLIRAAMRVDDLPVVVGRISDSGKSDTGKVWEFGDTVRAAQAAFVESDPAAALITTTDDYGYSDTWHYDTAGYIDLGRQFANAMMEVEGGE